MERFEAVSELTARLEFQFLADELAANSIFVGMFMPLPKPNAVVFAKDVARLAGFYQALAGMLVVHAAKDHVVLDGGAYQLVLHGIPKKIADAIHITEPPELREDTALKMCFPVASIAHAREAAVALGGQVYPSKKEWVARGFRACDGFDPEGNVFQVRESEETP